MNYTIGDFVIRLKNASLANRKEVRLPFAKTIKAIAKVLVKEGFLASVVEDEVEGKKQLLVTLRYQSRHPAVSDVKIVSKPSLRIYLPSNEILSDQGKAMISILSTSSGMMTGKEAVKKGIGGELLFKIW
ncbi:30S ribosomal protein S8 [soil metagenome]